VIRPVLDTMQTIPAFVYLVPVVMLIGIGNVSGVIVTIIFALPPLVRLTSLGIRNVNPSWSRRRGPLAQRRVRSCARSSCRWRRRRSSPG
jgi:ABC-type nitrate/sulfonate/bicarbonate transport system permease component